MKKILAVLMLYFSVCSSYALDLKGLQNAHDPGTITKDGDTYFNFTTGTGIWYSTSTDLITWSAGAGPVFSATNYPSWIASNFPNWAKGDFWAPDLIQMNSYYYLYYSVTDTFGQSKSAIGVARTASLKNPSWTDLGIVIQSSTAAGQLNAIDAQLFRDFDGKVYMSYGSFFGGIGVAEINQSTGKLATNVTKVLGGNGLDMEGATITRNGAYYYLFVNRGNCCANPLTNTTYSMEIYRSSNVLGPYSSGGTIMPTTDSSAPTHRGPGHVGILKQDGCNYVSTHYVDTADGGAKLQIMKMTYDSNGWPVLTRNFTSISSCGGVSDGMYTVKSGYSGNLMTVAGASTTNGAMVQQASSTGAKNQQWYVIGHGDTYYSIINANSLLSLDDYNNSTSSGTPIAQWGYWGGDGQQWNLISSGSNHKIKTKLSGMMVDVNQSSSANAQLIQLPVSASGNANTSQLWTLTRK